MKNRRTEARQTLVNTIAFALRGPAALFDDAAFRIAVKEQLDDGWKKDVFARFNFDFDRLVASVREEHEIYYGD